MLDGSSGVMWSYLIVQLVVYEFEPEGVGDVKNGIFTLFTLGQGYV
jgi:hypothetical protein